MKKILIIIVLTFFSFSQAQKEKIFIPKVDSTFEKFDFEKDKNIYKINDIIYIASKTEPAKEFKLKKQEGDSLIIVTYIKRNNKVEDLKQEIYYNNSSLMLLNFFYPSGNIKRKGLLFNNGDAIDTWYFYEEKGELSKIENLDKYYSFGYQKVIDYCIANKIPLRMGYEDRNNDRKAKITKEKKDGVPVWSIAWEYFKKTPVENKLRKMKYVTPAGQRRLVTILLDGKTGKQLSKTDIQIHYIE